MTLKTLVISLFLLLAAGVALALLTDAVTGRRAAATNAAFSPLGMLLQVDGVTLHALTRGTGPDLVLIHGASGNSFPRKAHQTVSKTRVDGVATFRPVPAYQICADESFNRKV